MERIIINFNRIKTREQMDLDIPSDLTAHELVIALNKALNLGIDMNDVKKCYLKAENPRVLLRGNRKLKDFGIADGSKIIFTE